MLPLLKFTADGVEHGQSDAVDTLARHFNTTEADRKEMLPSGRQIRFDNRVAWAIVFLRKAKFLERTRRGRFKITDRGLEILKSKPAKIDTKFLLQHGDAEFRKFHQPGDPEVPPGGITPKVIHTKEGTPREVMEAGYQEMRQDLAQELLERTKKCSPRFFEYLVVELLEKMGYGGYTDAAKVVGQTGDGGVDGIIKEDKLGLDIIYLQAKKWENTVGSPVVRDFFGSLAAHNARKGVIITTSQFSVVGECY
jgi:restriction system protein